MINAIVLAGGESKRMGRPKPLLRFEDTTFLGHIVSVLGHCDVEATTVVLGAEAETIGASVDLSGVKVVINEDYRMGQLSSLIAGMSGMSPETEAIVLCLVDHPFVTVEVVNRIVSKFRETGSRIIVPVFHGERGHPTLFARALFEELLNAPQDEGARHVLYSNEQSVLELETSEKGILIGIDTPDDYELHFGTAP
ncbi:MAG: nucleotidyltransferase family protein [Phycisphaerales bacterium]|nr:MAG: nucleotidyltransferase family protein [Phycisphaerales bacterium]